MSERDFVGYGLDLPKVRWPGDARIAVSVVVNYEEGAEYSLLDGDPQRESNSEVPSPVPLDMRDIVNESMFEYGSRVGVWRLLNIFDKYDVKVTFFASALAIERNPALGPEIARRGHEVCGHGYRWEEYFKLSEEEQRADIRRTIESLERTVGQRPLGWWNRLGVGPNIRELLQEEGGFLYDNNSVGDDLPYYTKVNGKPWLVVPYSLDVNDMGFWRGVIVTADEFYSRMKDAFDRLYEEGAEAPKMMSVGLHCRITGRPYRSMAVERFLQYAKSHPRVWFARRDEIARLWLGHYPPTS